MFLLGLAPFADPRWLTFKQANDLGGRVKRGALSSIVTLWKLWDVDCAENEAKGEGPNSGQRKQLPLLRFYRVFNVEQVDGLSLPSSVGRPLLMDEQRIHRAEEVIHSMPNRPILREWSGEACYGPSNDTVFMPYFRRFDTPDDYYATAFHELAHATGHEKRLGRFDSNAPPSFGSESYGREELIAELTSGFCCSYIGLDNSTIQGAANYIGGWIKTLSEEPKVLLSAASAAQRAADMIFGVGDFATP